MSNLCNSFLGSSFRCEGKETSITRYSDVLNQILPSDKSHSSEGPVSGKSFAETQVELFNYQHSLLILHLLAAVMFGPSLVARLQVFLSDFTLLFLSIICFVDFCFLVFAFMSKGRKINKTVFLFVH